MLKASLGVQLFDKEIKLKRKLESYNNADEKCFFSDIFNFEPVFILLTQKLWLLNSSVCSEDMIDASTNQPP